MQGPDPFEVIAGQSEAEAFLIALRASLGTGDELYHWLRGLKQGANDDRLRGAARHLQKQLERTR